MSTCAYMCEHMYTNACVRSCVCICTCISALGRGGEQPKNLTPPLGGGGGGKVPNLGPFVKLGPARATIYAGIGYQCIH